MEVHSSRLQQVKDRILELENQIEINKKTGGGSNQTQLM
jgi:hypothetical protein